MFHNIARLIISDDRARRQPQPEDARPICQVRGYCGPIINQAFYASLTVWAGFGDCVECGCTVPAPPGLRNFESYSNWPVGKQV